MIIKKFKKGFTLIELLVVIGVLAVIAAGVVALINPQDKLRQANDAKVQSDLGQYVTALQSYAVQRPDGAYPAVANFAALQTTLVTSGELVTAPSAPTNSSYNFAPYGAAPAATGQLYFRLVSGKYSSQCTGGTPVPYWSWCSTTGRVGLVCGTAAAVPACP